MRGLHAALGVDTRYCFCGCGRRTRFGNKIFSVFGQIAVNTVYVLREATLPFVQDDPRRTEFVTDLIAEGEQIIESHRGVIHKTLRMPPKQQRDQIFAWHRAAEEIAIGSVRAVEAREQSGDWLEQSLASSAWLTVSVREQSQALDQLLDLGTVSQAAELARLPAFKEQSQALDQWLGLDTISQATVFVRLRADREHGRLPEDRGGPRTGSIHDGGVSDRVSPLPALESEFEWRVLGAEAEWYATWRVSQDLPELATNALVQGLDTQSLRLLAGERLTANPIDLGELFARALGELERPALSGRRLLATHPVPLVAHRHRPRSST